MVDPNEVLLFHPDHDIIATYEHGCHEYDTIADAKDAYVNGDLSHLEFRAVLDDCIEPKPF